MLLSDLMNGDQAAPLAPLDIVGLAADSRDVRPGYLFAAIAGSAADGRDFIPDALGHGAVAVLAPPGTAITDSDIRLITDDNPRRRLAQMAARFFQDQPETAVAVTGTNGKTSVALFTEQIWHRLGYRAASVGTLGIHGQGLAAPLMHTTPEPVTLHRALSDIAGHGIDHVAMEASSHGLDQYRLDGVRLTAAAFTNLSHDHLDYHASEADYLSAKARLFGEVLRPGATAVLNADAAVFETLNEICQGRGLKVLSYGKAGADIRLNARTANATGQHLDLTVLGRDYRVELPLSGSFQVDNVACALGLVLACGADVDAAIDALGTLEGIKGRLQRVASHPYGAPIYVDYAHTPEALDNVLQALKPHAADRLVVVFGCGGDRDQSKRRIMGEVACSYADSVIVTDDNPRNEDAAVIRRQVMDGCHSAIEIADRAEAIHHAVAELGPGDVLVIAGKGHEQGQIIKGDVRHFDDAEQALAAVADLGRSAS